MIHIHYSGRLGNNLLQFAVGYAIAKLSDTPLNALPIPGFPGTNRFSLGPLAPLGSVPAMPENPRPSHPTLSRFVETARTSDLIVRGWPFRYSYFAEFNRELRELLIPEGAPFAPSGERDVVFHMRRGDYFSPANRSRFGYPLAPFIALLERLDRDRCLLVTDSPSKITWVANTIRNLEVVASSRMNDFLTIYHAKTVVLSPSTFGWCAQWLGAVQKVWLPLELGPWTTRNHFSLADVPDLRVARFP